MILLAVSLFFTHPAPLDMPRAEAYFVKDADGGLRLEDRYNRDDLWTSRAVLGRWEDDDGRFFTVSRLDTVPPKFAEGTLTRTDYAKEEVALDPKKDLALRDQAVARLAPVETVADPSRPRQRLRGFREVLYYEGTNAAAVVCAFLPDAPKAPWYLATWELVDGDDHDWARELFEGEILGKWEAVVASDLRSEASGTRGGQGVPRPFRAEEKIGASAPSPQSLAPNPLSSLSQERELLRRDARHSVTNYTAWHVTEAEEFSVLDNLPPSVRFVSALTNDLAAMRRRYAEVMPSPVNGSNVLCVARIFASRDDYLAAAGEGMAWSAAYWNPQRRELVAHLPEGGADELLRTIRHEAFHQYLSYATSMVAASPWLNEGYAQYFEDEDATDWALGGDVDAPRIEALAKALPGVMGMDYEEFYAGDDAARRLKYRLAWSVAVFLEKGAPRIRFQPFRDLKRDYIAALLKGRDMRLATAEAFGSHDRLALFIAEWKKFWKGR